MKSLFQSDKFKGRLRAIGRSSADVNSARAEFDGSLKLSEKRGVPTSKAPLRRTTFSHQDSIKQDAKQIKALKKGKNDAAEDEIEASVFAILRNGDERYAGGNSVPQRDRVCTIRGTLREINALAADDRFVSLELAETINAPVTQNDGLVESAANRRFANEEIANLELDHGDGEGILVGVIDSGGFDFSHPDFMQKDANKTRFVRIWDQGQNNGRDHPKGFKDGAEITEAHMNAAIKKSAKFGLPATELEPQTQMTPGSHATHVASIAAGNKGVCNKANIAGVLISLLPKEHDRRRSFYDASGLAHAVDYLLQLADELEAEGKTINAVSINISLGTNGGPHDDSAPITRWLDSALTEPGRAICVAAGNAGQEAPQHAQDSGFIVGRIHTAGRVAASGLEERIEMVVVGSGIEDISENELEIWYQPQDRISVQIKPPGGAWSKPVPPGKFIRSEMLPDRTFYSIFNELYDSSNGCNKISVYLSPFLEGPIVGVTPGVWTIKLIGEDIRDGRYHGWIERDDPHEVLRNQSGAYWQFPSFFTQSSNVDNSSVSSLACGSRIIGVANYDEGIGKMNISSSQGPTRDGREKPDVAAPGTSILAANGFDEDALWVEKTGTSMASPYVAGLVGNSNCGQIELNGPPHQLFWVRCAF